MIKKEEVKDTVTGEKFVSIEKTLIEIKMKLQDIQFFIDSSGKAPSETNPLGSSSKPRYSKEGNIYTDIGIAVVYLNSAIAEIQKNQREKGELK